MEMPPLTPEAQEAFFQEQVAEGEKLATQGEYLTSMPVWYLVPSARTGGRLLTPRPQRTRQLGQGVLPSLASLPATRRAAY
jgi:hypothetical protein